MFFKFTFERFTPMVGVMIAAVLLINLLIGAVLTIAGAALAHIGWNLV